MGGYADRAHGVQGMLDPLEVHAVTFADDDHRFALIVADLICVNADVVDRVRTAVRPHGVNSCWVAATHTHASPEAGCVPGGTTTARGLADRLLRAAAAATSAALADEWESLLRPTRVEVSGLGGPRNVTDASAAVPVDALVVARGDGGVAGVLVVNPVHPTVLPADNHQVSADLSGGIRRALSTDGRWVVVATGAAGNISTRHTRHGRTRREVDRLGDLVAANLKIDTWLPAEPSGGVVPPVLRIVELAPKTPDEFGSVPELATHRRSEDERSRQVLDQGRRIAGELAAAGRTAPYEIAVEAVGLGEVTLVAVPAELFLDLGESIRTADPADTVIVVGYANGYLGYLASRGTPPTYETLVTPVRDGSGDEVASVAIELVRSIACSRSA